MNRWKAWAVHSQNWFGFSTTQFMAKNASFFIYSIELFTWSQYQVFYAASHYPPENQYIRSGTTMRKQIEPFDVWNAKTEPGKLEPRRIHASSGKPARSLSYNKSSVNRSLLIHTLTHMQRLLVCKENKSEKAGCYRFHEWHIEKKC
jgi:hypothetical protein